MFTRFWGCADSLTDAHTRIQIAFGTVQMVAEAQNMLLLAKMLKTRLRLGPGTRNARCGWSSVRASSHALRSAQVERKLSALAVEIVWNYIDFILPDSIVPNHIKIPKTQIRSRCFCISPAMQKNYFLVFDKFTKNSSSVISFSGHQLFHICELFSNNIDYRDLTFDFLTSFCPKLQNHQ